MYNKQSKRVVDVMLCQKVVHCNRWEESILMGGRGAVTGLPGRPGQTAAIYRIIPG